MEDEKMVPRKRRQRPCRMCMDGQIGVDYKDVNKLKRYMSDRAKIVPRRMSGLCAKHQRHVTSAIKLARQIALVPFVAD